MMTKYDLGAVSMNNMVDASFKVHRIFVARLMNDVRRGRVGRSPRYRSIKYNGLGRIRLYKYIRMD